MALLEKEIVEGPTCDGSGRACPAQEWDGVVLRSLGDGLEWKKETVL